MRFLKSVGCRPCRATTIAICTRESEQSARCADLNAYTFDRDVEFKDKEKKKFECKNEIIFVPKKSKNYPHNWSADEPSANIKVIVKCMICHVKGK